MAFLYFLPICVPFDPNGFLFPHLLGLFDLSVFPRLARLPFFLSHPPPLLSTCAVDPRESRWNPSPRRSFLRRAGADFCVGFVFPWRFDDEVLLFRRRLVELASFFGRLLFFLEFLRPEFYLIVDF